MKFWKSPRQLGLLLVVFGIVVAILLTLRPGPSGAGVQWLSTVPPQQRSRLGFLGAWSGPVRGQLLQWKRALFGAPPIVTVTAILFEMDPGMALPDWKVLSGATNESGEKILVVRDGVVPAMDPRLSLPARARIFSRPQLVLPDGMQGVMASYLTQPLGRSSNAENIGFWLNVTPHVNARDVDLQCFITRNEIAVRSTNGAEEEPFLNTNMNFGARVIIPTNASVLLLGNTTNRSGKVTGAILSPVTTHPRRK
jgi:hypothetical protein